MLSRKFMCVKKVAELIQVGKGTVRHWIHEGLLPAIDVGREWRIAPKELETFLEQRSTRSLNAPAAKKTD